MTLAKLLADKAAGFSGAEPAALLFDLDGTLLDSLPDLATATDRMLVELGYEAAGAERVHGWIGDGARQLVHAALVFAQAGENTLNDASLARALAIYMHHYAECCTDRSQLFPGVRDALRKWGEHGIKMACVTNKAARFTEPLLAHFELLELLPVAVSGDTLTQRKPSAMPLLFACEQLGVAPQNAVMIGDSRNDVLAARAAGMPVVCVSYGYNHGRAIAAEAPDIIVDSLLELI